MQFFFSLKLNLELKQLKRGLIQWSMSHIGLSPLHSVRQWRYQPCPSCIQKWLESAGRSQTG